MGYEIEQTADGTLVVRVRGAVTAGSVRGLYDALVRLSTRRRLHAVSVDFSGVDELDSPAAAAVCLAFDELRRAGKHAELLHVAPRQRLTFDLVPALPSPAGAPPAPPALERLGALGVRVGRALVEIAELLVDTLSSALRTLAGRERARWGAALEHGVRLGADATFIVGLLAFLTGLILAFQAVYQLRRFGAAIFVAEIVSLGVVREFASLMTAIILAGRSTSSMAAELGTMAVRDEVAALRTIGIDPVSYLVLPRLLAITFMQPALTLLAMVLGIAGGLLVTGALGLPLPAVYGRMQEAVTGYDFSLGLLKSLLFAWIVGFTGCFMGLTTTGGPSSVGHSTTRAVVAAILLIVIVDSVVTTLWTLAGYGER